MPVDFKKLQKELYQPGTAPTVIAVPEMNYIAVDGKGDPNTQAKSTLPLLSCSMAFPMRSG